MQKTSSLAHDNARRLHGGASSRDLKRLRERTLTTSLDLATLEEDVKTYNGRERRGLEPQFFAAIRPALGGSDDKPTSTPRRPEDFNKNQRRDQKKMARDLVAFDAGYRDVLNTVVALGASLDSRRVQRVAVWVSVASLGVAVVTLWATSRSAPDVVQVVSALLGSWFA